MCIPNEKKNIQAIMKLDTLITWCWHMKMNKLVLENQKEINMSKKNANK